MEQEIRFCSVPGGRIAYATAGSGPPLVIPALWISHVELEWEFPEYRAFIAALAETHTVIRYDRLGTGLSDRDAARPSGATPTRSRRSRRSSTRSASSASTCSASRSARQRRRRVRGAPPRARRSLAFVGALRARRRRSLRAPLREALAATVRAHWGAGSRVLSDVWLPGRERGAARPVRAAAAGRRRAPRSRRPTLEAVYATDVRDLLPAVTAPALVIHRRATARSRIALGRDLAARLPNARFVALDGELHLPWLGDTAPVLAALQRSCDGRRRDAAGPLSAREQEVLRLVGAGLSDAEIAARLVVSPHTVHRHVANIRTKLGPAVARGGGRLRRPRRADLSHRSLADRQRPDERRHAAPARRAATSPTRSLRARAARASAGCTGSRPRTRATARARRSCQRASRVESARTCSMNTSRPPGRSTRRISRTAATGSATVHSTIVDTTTSNDASVERQRLGGRRDGRRPPAQLPQHRRFRLGQDEVHALGVVREVQTGPGAHLEHAPAHVRQQRPPVRGHPAPLAEGQERVIEQRADARPQAVDRHPPVLRGDALHHIAGIRPSGFKMAG